MGIPCRHFFAVLTRTVPGTHRFNIAQFHPHWHSPQQRGRALERDWIVLKKTAPFNDEECEEEVEENAGNIDGLKSRKIAEGVIDDEHNDDANSEGGYDEDEGSNEVEGAGHDMSTKPNLRLPLNDVELHQSMPPQSASQPSSTVVQFQKPSHQPFQDRNVLSNLMPAGTPAKEITHRSPRRTPKRQMQYADLLSVLDTFMKLNPSQIQVTEVSQIFAANIRQLENDRRVANLQDVPLENALRETSSPAAPSSLDPLIMPRQGRKRLARILSQGERKRKR